jgi:NADH-quinone oxidoreductase subunit D
MPYTDRLDYFCSLTNNWAYALAVEKLVRPGSSRARRVHSRHPRRAHAHSESRLAIGFLIQEMGASGTPLMYAFKEREKILDLFESLTGSRMMCNYMRFGGCRVDVSAGLARCRRKVVAGCPQFVDEFEALLSE